jgi:DNA-binding transcriptional MerR regulator
MQNAYTLAEVSEKALVLPRSVQNWAAKKVLRPVSRTSGKGTGVHRLFSTAELEITAIIGVISRKSAPLTALRDVANWLRSVQQRGKKFGLSSFEDGDRFIKEQQFLALRGTDIQGTQTDQEFAAYWNLDYVPAGPPVASKQDLDDLRGWLIYEEAKLPDNKVVLYFAADENGSWNTQLDYEGVKFQTGNPLNDFDEYQVVRIGRILSRLYSVQNRLEVSG